MAHGWAGDYHANISMNDLKFAFRQLLKNPGFTAVVVLALALGREATTSCGAASVPDTVSDHAKPIDIGGRKLNCLTRGRGTPTVVIEAGMGEPPIESGSWRAVIDDIAKTNRVFIYDRAGLGASDPAPKLPRTSKDVANDLHALLTKAGVPGPYVLVGQSIGGLHIRMLADQFPDEVLGMVLVDSAHPDQDAKWLAALGPAVANEPESVRKSREFLASRTSPDSNSERIDPVASSSQFRAARGLGDKPLVILSHSSSFRLDPNLPEEVSLRLEKVCQELQADLKRLSSHSTLRQSANGGHHLQVDDPALVIAGIRQVLDAVNQKTK